MGIDKDMVVLQKYVPGSGREMYHASSHDADQFININVKEVLDTVTAGCSCQIMADEEVSFMLVWPQVSQVFRSVYFLYQSHLSVCPHETHPP
jgi:hypothetical protein